MSAIKQITQEERDMKVMREKNVMLKLVDILEQDKMISLNEKIELTNLIQKGADK